MTDSMNDNALRLFVGTFDYTNSEVDREGSFTMTIEANRLEDAIEGFRARLDDLAKTTEQLGPLDVYVDTIVELPRGCLTHGVLVSHREIDEFGTVLSFPTQGEKGSRVHILDIDDAEAPGEVAIFWSGAAGYNAKWKLFWCETGDHDEDWFVIARNADDAASYHVEAEGYDEDDAWAELVCVIPAAAQPLAEKEGEGWPSNELLVACGAEFLPNVPQDGAHELRQQMGSGARVVRINGRIYGEGDIVSNTMTRIGKIPPS